MKMVGVVLVVIRQYVMVYVVVDVIMVHVRWMGVRVIQDGLEMIVLYLYVTELKTVIV